jgi:chemotaxis protein MotB
MYDYEGSREVDLLLDKKAKNQDSWLLTYADMITLLLVFFVLILSVSITDQSKFEEVIQGIKGSGFGDSKRSGSPFKDLKQNLTSVIEQKKLQDKVSVEKTQKGLIIELSSKLLYDSGSADLKSEAMPSLQEVAKVIKDFDYKNYIVEIEGHTDDIPSSSIQFPTNWELSTARATRVVRFFAKNGVVLNKMKASGYAHTRAKVDNKDAKSRALNRRVSIKIEREYRGKR